MYRSGLTIRDAAVSADTGHRSAVEDRSLADLRPPPDSWKKEKVARFLAAGVPPSLLTEREKRTRQGMEFNSDSDEITSINANPKNISLWTCKFQPYTTHCEVVQ